LTATVVVLAGQGASTEYLANALRDKVEVAAYILEDVPSRSRMLKRRIRHLGLVPVIGQVVFVLFQKLILNRLARNRIGELEEEYVLRRGYPDGTRMRFVQSVNEAATLSLLQSLEPDLVVVNGTRIIARRVLEGVDAPFINTHVGITPRYRGVHGGYWAIAEGQEALFGATVHYVDPGVDTGEVIAQVTGTPHPRDSFPTYPVLQYGFVLPTLVDVIARMAQGETPKPSAPMAERSVQYFHPTLWGYLWRWITTGTR